MTALLALEGVLRTEEGDPIPEGFKLFRTLNDQYRMVIATNGTKAEALHWLKVNMLFGYADIIDNAVEYPGQDLRARQLAVLRSAGRVELLVDPDADRCADAVKSGVLALLFASPKFIRRVRQVPGWDVVTEELARQRELQAESQSTLNRWE